MLGCRACHATWRDADQRSSTRRRSSTRHRSSADDPEPDVSLAWRKQKLQMRDGSAILVRTYSSVFLFRRSPGESSASARPPIHCATLKP